MLDDDEIFLSLIERKNNKLNFANTIIFFTDGNQVISQLKRHQNSPENLPNVILLDLNMPAMDGWEFIEAYLPLHKKFAKQVRLHILTSSINPSEILKAKSYPEIESFIVKPFSTQELINIIQNLG